MCHESLALDYWYYEKKNMSAETRKNAENIINFTWFKYLNNCFKTVILNEIYLIQNFFIWLSVTIEWLNLNFHVCMFIISLFNILENFRDFLSLLFNNNELWISILLKKLDINIIINLFKLQDNYSAAVLYYIIQAVKKFVYYNLILSAITEF